jgi:hypothetical protein
MYAGPGKLTDNVDFFDVESWQNRAQLAGNPRRQPKLSGKSEAFLFQTAWNAGAFFINMA